MVISQSGKYRTGQDSLTKTEYALLLEKINNYEDEVLIRLTVATGMRREDVVNVNVADIDLAEGKLSFYEHKKRKIHTVYIPDGVVQVIEKYLRTLPKKQKKLLDLCSRTAYNRFQSCLVRAGLRRRPFHALRATCIKFCQAEGWTAEQTARHVDDRISTIQKHYTVPSEGEMKDIAKGRGFA